MSFKKRHFPHETKFQVLKKKKKKDTYLRKAAIFPFKESEAFSTFIDREHT